MQINRCPLLAWIVIQLFGTYWEHTGQPWPLGKKNFFLVGGEEGSGVVWMEEEELPLAVV